MNFSDPFQFPEFQHMGDLKEPPVYTPGMVWEEKMDGIRAMVSSTSIKLRNVNVPKHQLLLRDGRQVPRGCLLDGEIMATDDSFTAVQGRVTRGQWKKLIFVPFDVLYWDGKSLRKSPFSDRRIRLQRIDPGPVVLEPVFEDGQMSPRLPKVPLQWEGVVGKRLDDPYQAGRRGSWVRWKQTGMMTFRLIGFAEGEGAWKGTNGKVIFGLQVPQTGQYLEWGRAQVPTFLQRYEFTHHPEKYIGRPIWIRHYGMMKTKFRNPIFEGFADE